MRKETWSVGFVCLLGAFIGTLVALEIATRFTYGSWFWSVGALIGGLVAYCAVDFRHFCTIIACSYHKNIEIFANQYHAIAGRKPNYLYWRATVMATLGLGAVAVSFFLLTVILDFGIDELVLNNHPLPATFLSCVSFVAWVIVVFTTTAIIMEYNYMMPSEDEKKEKNFSYKKRLVKEAREGWKCFLYGNPVVLPFFFVVLTAQTLSKCIKWIWQNRYRIWRTVCSASVSAYRFVSRVVPLIIQTVKQFAVGAFFYVHSERRKICFVDATLGATAGYFLGSAIAGALIGAILGIVNYEIVSIRWLKIVPAKATK